MHPSITGFTFVRNGQMLGYPVAQSLQSLLQLCDDVVVAVGKSDDNTLEIVQSLLRPNDTLIETVWDDSLRFGGRILAQQTDLALAACRGEWCVYLQADEVLHEDDYRLLRGEIARYNERTDIEALLFRYHHLFGSYDYEGVGRQWYRREIRAIRNTGKVMSWGDAQGFRMRETDRIRKLRAVQTEARIFHYGWVRHPNTMYLKQRAFSKLYHDDAWIEENIPTSADFPACYEVKRFVGSHPAVMLDLIESDRPWTSKFNPTISTPRPFRVLVTDAFEKLTGLRIGEYRNFTEVKHV